MTFKLSSPQDAAKEIAGVFLDNQAVVIEVKEDKCFDGEAYWPLGKVTLDADYSSLESISQSLQHGAFEWTIKSYDEALEDLRGLLKIEPPAGSGKQDQYERALAQLPRILDSVAATAVRTGLIHPIFDSHSIENMPFRQGTTVVADTSGVLQGALDFVSTFLHPAARIKIPAVVHMEVVNQADNFLKRRRAPKVLNRSALLLDHILSQAGQRALLRLELRTDTEVERSLLVGDPLRNAFQPYTENGVSDLQLSVPLRSYCDRLILEAARQHQSQSNPGHRLQLLTGDQGFARMALAEGVEPLYFRAISGKAFFGQILTGTRFHPFRATLYQVALQSVLWELATAFGSVRIASTDGARWVEIAAFGEELTWSPVHSHNDLLWVRNGGLPPASDASISAERPEPSSITSNRVSQRTKAASMKAERAAESTQRGSYRFNVERMLNLIIRLANEGHLPDARVYELSGTKDERGFSEFRRFLLSGALAVHQDGRWTLTDSGLTLSAAISEGDSEKIAAGLSCVPSVGLFFKELSEAEIGKPLKLELPVRAETTYKTLAEICLLAAFIPSEGYYPTTSKPTLRDFTSIAVNRFKELESGDGIVAVGAWLEALVKHDGIHPERSRRYLDEAQASRMINRSTEGSTTDTRHDQHTVRILRGGAGGVKIETVHLYRGDFLIPNKSSSSLRLGAIQ